MFSSLLITFRETLEAALVVGIIFTFLQKTNQRQFFKNVWQGVAAGVGASILLAIIFERFFGEFEGRAEQIFEGTLMFITVAFLTWMIMWVHKQADMVQKLKQKVAEHAEKGSQIGIFLVVASSVLREGVETVLYLKASSVVGGSNQLLGALAGVIIALFVVYAFFYSAVKVNLKLIFSVVGVLLMLFAAGLLAHGVHEFQEAGLLPIFSFDPVFNISRFLDHEGMIGGWLRVLFGYTSQPTFIELIAYFVYLSAIIWIERFREAKVTAAIA